MQRLQPSRRAFLAGLGAACAAPALGHASASPIEDLSGAAFGTRWQLTGPSGLGQSRQSIEALFADIDCEMSPWRADSTISRFNASNSGMPVSAEMSRVVQVALDLASRSEGAFDPTVGPLVARWGFGPIEQGAAPDWRNLSLQGGQLGKAESDLTLDLCGIAKGRALDRAVDLMRGQGAEHLLFDLGGELRALGGHPEGRDWRVAIESPLPGQSVAAILHLPAGMAVATSGVSAQGYVLNGRVWGHIMDPNRAGPVEGRLRAVSVLAPDAMTADGWATALFAAGDEGGPDLARAHDVPALFLYETDTALCRVVTGGMGDVLA
ncbi:FAD:protein FMN transferase [Pseudooceanicola algae]|uniref:FAD:protein FMN transferase n=1 Tax=Pseudooceanicola algae TaxID=1537215 RepID=A0A418SDC8_9RHOB|nr:FAD:protein FMN transferase [Pseudooceanicola algae]QPM92302.1 FAD:protein FMN transferase [Pseudooceanicola algae]